MIIFILLVLGFLAYLLKTTPICKGTVIPSGIAFRMF